MNSKLCITPRRLVVAGAAAVLVTTSLLFPGSAHAQEGDPPSVPSTASPDTEQTPDEGSSQHGIGHLGHAESHDPEAPGAESGEGAFPGIQIGGGLLGIVQSTSGAKYDTAFGVGRLELEVGVELSELANLFFITEGITGDGPTADTDNYSELNANAGGTWADEGVDRFHIREAGVELSRGLFTFTVGKLDLAAFIDTNEYANDERTQFLSGAFVNDTSHVFPRDGYTPGAVLAFTPGPLTFTVAGASHDNSGDRLFDEVIGIGEAGLAYGGDGWGGNFRVHAAVDGARKKTSSEPAYDFGCGASADQELGRHVAIFARYGWRETDAIDVDVESSWSAGVHLHRFFPSRGEDVIGIAAGEIVVADTRTTENIYEAYYRAPISEAAAISGHVQVLSDALSDPDAGTVTAYGIRLHVTF